MLDGHISSIIEAHYRPCKLLSEACCDFSELEGGGTLSSMAFPSVIAGKAELSIAQ